TKGCSRATLGRLDAIFESGQATKVRFLPGEPLNPHLAFAHFRPLLVPIPPPKNRPELSKAG
ncbi:MAG TPA: hypothetical protein VIJ07_25745, partial [Dermatophilaceae bacterium]